MKKTILLGALMLSAAAAFAQESRQDISVSGFGLIGPTVHGNAITLYPSVTTGVLLSYRYLLTPRSGLELNYSFAQNTNFFSTDGHNYANQDVHSRQQELTVAYVYSRTYKRYNPFVEAGVGGVSFTPILEGSSNLDLKSNTGVGGLFGGGVAYELSPSFDVRLEYRGIFVKAPDYKVPGDIFKTSRYEVVSMPTLGFAYHF
jgi:outer membrane immunogenic protein